MLILVLPLKLLTQKNYNLQILLHHLRKICEEKLGLYFFQ